MTIQKAEINMMDSGHNDERNLENEPDCQSCGGSGQIDIGDCEDGVTDECPACHGTGKEPQGDKFIPERDAFTPGD